MNEEISYPTINIGGIVYTPMQMSDVSAIIHEAVETAIQKNGTAERPKEFIKGIHDLASFLGVSPAKAQSLKNSGKIPYSQSGRIVLFDPEKVLSALSNISQKNKGGRK